MFPVITAEGIATYIHPIQQLIVQFTPLGCVLRQIDEFMHLSWISFKIVKLIACLKMDGELVPTIADTAYRLKCA